LPIRSPGCIMINVDAVRGFRRFHSAVRCPVCRYRPDNPHEHDDMLADLSVVWWTIAHGRIRLARHCSQCAPKMVFASIDCAHCGDGPLVALKSPTRPAWAYALIRIGLTTSGWAGTPAGEWVCAGCQTGR
jgi:hypothetical protein